MLRIDGVTGAKRNKIVQILKTVSFPHTRPPMYVGPVVGRDIEAKADAENAGIGVLSEAAIVRFENAGFDCSWVVKS